MRMSVRTIVLVLPAVIALACTSRSRRAETATAPPQAPEEQQAATQPGMEGHAGDQFVMGTVTSATSYSLSVKSPLGEEKTLEIVPQTVVTIDGREATPLELEEGQEVRASFNQVEGRDVAIKIESIGTESGQGGTGMPDQGTGESPAAPEAGDTTEEAPPVTPAP